MELKKSIMNKLFFLPILVLAFSCQSDSSISDAYGNFEATEILVSSLAPGKLLYLDIDEGQVVKKGQVVGLVDTINLHLKKEQLKAAYQSALSRKPGIETQKNVLLEEKSSVEKELARFRRLADEGAAARKQAEDLEDRLSVLKQQIKNIDAQFLPLNSELNVIEAQIAQIDQQISDSRIIAPITGTILTKIAEPYEVVAAGSPVFRIASLDTLVLKAYISGSQLDDVLLGQQVEVLIDRDKTEYEHYPGTVSWISATAEFTPKTIQTREERIDQVYAIKIKTPNSNGKLKIGMPGEVIFNTLN